MSPFIEETTYKSGITAIPAPRVPSRFDSVMINRVVACMQGHMADLQIRCAIRFSARLDERRLARAARLMLDAEPILGCRFVKHWWRPYWQRHADLDRIETFSLVNSMDPEHDMTDFMVRLIDPCKDPLVQVRIIRSESDTLCIKADHMVTDAFWIKKYAYRLASTYRKLAHDSEYVPEANLQGSRSLRQISRLFGTFDKLRIIRRGFRDFKRRFHPQVYWAFPQTGQETSNKLFITRMFSPERFYKIKEYGRKHNATVNEIMLAAYYRALFDIIKPGPNVPLRLACTVDIRRHLPPGESGVMCNLANFAYLNIGTELGDTLVETVAKVHDDMKALKDDYLSLGDYPFTAIFFNLLPFSWAQPIFNMLLKSLIRAGNAPPIFTNTGIIDHEKLAFDDCTPIDAYILAPTCYPPFFCMGLTSIRQSFTLSVSFFEPAVKRQVAEGLLDHMDSELPG